MLSRPLDHLELTAIDRYLERRPATICPPTGRGEPIPHLPPIGWRLAVQLSAAQRQCGKNVTGAKAA